MKLNKKYIAQEINAESYLVPTGDAGWTGIVRGNKTLGTILTLLKDETTEEGIISAMCARFDAPEAAIAADVRKALSELRQIGALDE